VSSLLPVAGTHGCQWKRAEALMQLCCRGYIFLPSHFSSVSSFLPFSSSNIFIPSPPTYLSHNKYIYRQRRLAPGPARPHPTDSESHHLSFSLLAISRAALHSFSPNPLLPSLALKHAVPCAAFHSVVHFRFDARAHITYSGITHLTLGSLLTTHLTFTSHTHHSSNFRVPGQPLEVTARPSCGLPAS